VYKLGLLDHLAQAHEIDAILVTELSRWGTDSDWARGVSVGIPDDPSGIGIVVIIDPRPAITAPHAINISNIAHRPISAPKVSRPSGRATIPNVGWLTLGSNVWRIYTSWR
jgi:hypothetical protein